MSRKHQGLAVMPKKNGLKKLVWGLGLLLLVIVMIKHPYETSAAVHAVAHSVSVFLSAWGDH